MARLARYTAVAATHSAAAPSAGCSRTGTTRHRGEEVEDGGGIGRAVRRGISGHGAEYAGGEDRLPGESSSDAPSLSGIPVRVWAEVPDDLAGYLPEGTDVTVTREGGMLRGPGIGDEVGAFGYRAFSTDRDLASTTTVTVLVPAVEASSVMSAPSNTAPMSAPNAGPPVTATCSPPGRPSASNFMGRVPVAGIR